MPTALLHQQCEQDELAFIEGEGGTSFAGLLSKNPFGFSKKPM